MKKIISNLDYNIMKNKTEISPLDEGVEVLSKPKRVRRTKHTFKLSDIKKEDVKSTGFTTKQQALKFLTNILDKKYMDFKSKDDLVNYIKTKKDNLEKHLDLSGFGRKKRITKKGKAFIKEAKDLESKLKKYEERKLPKKYHITAQIKRSITFTSKKGKVYTYAAGHQHGKIKTKDSLLDSRVIEATSEKEAQDIMRAEIEEAFDEDEYSGAATYNVDDVEFIDTVNESSLSQQHPSQMKMKLADHVEYSFTNEEKKYLNTDTNKQSTGTCVIDNFIGLYGEELKLTKDDFIDMHNKFYNIQTKKKVSDLDFGVQELASVSKSNNEFKRAECDNDWSNNNFGNYCHIHPPTYTSNGYDWDSSDEEPHVNPVPEVVEVEQVDISEGITPLFLEYVCKKYDISHYAFDINNKCFLKNVSKNRNHIALIYYAINDHMYLVNEEYKESLVKKAIAMDHTINTSLLETVEKVNVRMHRSAR
jgi:hypothetical protein